MIVSVRLEAVADDPGQVKEYFDAALSRLSLGLGDVKDEHYERIKASSSAPGGVTVTGGSGVMSFAGASLLSGYQGRIKIDYEVPMNAADEAVWIGESTRASDSVWALLGWIKDHPGLTKFWLAPVDGGEWTVTLATESQPRERVISGELLDILHQGLSWVGGGEPIG